MHTNFNNRLIFLVSWLLMATKGYAFTALVEISAQGFKDVTTEVTFEAKLIKRGLKSHWIPVGEETTITKQLTLTKDQKGFVNLTLKIPKITPLNEQHKILVVYKINHVNSKRCKLETKTLGTFSPDTSVVKGRVVLQRCAQWLFDDKGQYEINYVHSQSLCEKVL